jgi:hypothetical protein
LHIILNEPVLEEEVDYGSAENPFIMSAEQDTLRALTLSANHESIRHTSIFRARVPVMQRLGCKEVDIERVMIRDLTATMDSSDVDSVLQLPGSSRFKEFLFENTAICFPEQDNLSNGAIDMIASSQGFLWLYERADVLKMRSEDDVRVLERKEWVTAHEIVFACSIVEDELL